MINLQIENVTISEFSETLRQVVREELSAIQPKQPTSNYLTRIEVSKLLKISLPTLNEKIQELPMIWEKLTPRDKALFIKDLFPFFMAKLQNIEIQTEFDRLIDEQLDKIIDELKKQYYGQERKD